MDSILPTVSGEMEAAHNWLYSVVPASVNPLVNREIGIYLSGYCRFCQNGFTVRLPQSAKPGLLTQIELDIPLKGCNTKER